ncbi:MAG: PD-(D/E)XK nuclease family protein [Candidatus Gribaldobacteria bacterium]|nr:PD-(D/E)XK nuclease family protein [Candidatus Gribaldobacteria bacterium]
MNVTYESVKNSDGTLWISHSGLVDFKICPRAYYLKHLYRNPATGNKIRVTNPFLSLGTAVHYVLEGLANLEPQDRFFIPLVDRLEKVWPTFRGKKGGFNTQPQERFFKKRGVEMLYNLQNNPRLMLNSAYCMENTLPKIKLFADQEIVLVGSLDWIEKLSDGSAHIVDFKTSQSEESGESLQLPIYVLLAQYHLKVPIAKTSYWYLDKKIGIIKEIKLSSTNYYINLLREKALQIKASIENGDLETCTGGKKCDCVKYEKAINGEAQYVGCDKVMNRDLFYLG